MASYNPACALQIETHKGSITVGKDADLVVMNPDLRKLLVYKAITFANFMPLYGFWYETDVQDLQLIKQLPRR